MNYRVLCVDDDPLVRKGFQRSLGELFELALAESAAEALSHMRERGPFAVILSDYRMPEMDGIEFLSKAKEVCPTSVRMMLSGEADLEAAMKAVNEGQIFRFLTKPCPREVLAGVLQQGIDQYALVNAEKELLEKTLTGSVKLLTEVLSLVSPEAFGRATRVRQLARKLGQEMDLTDLWQVEIAALLSQIGCVTLTPDILSKAYHGRPMSLEEKEMYLQHPNVGAELVSNIPRLEAIAKNIRYQEKTFDGHGFPLDSVKGEQIPLGARIIKAALDFDAIISRGSTNTDAIKELIGRVGKYDTLVLRALEKVFSEELKYLPREISVSELSVGMILADNLLTTSGMLLVSRGHEITPSVLLRINNFSKTWGGLQEPIKVIVSKESPE